MGKQNKLSRLKYIMHFDYSVDEIRLGSKASSIHVLYVSELNEATAFTHESKFG